MTLFEYLLLASLFLVSVTVGGAVIAIVTSADEKPPYGCTHEQSRDTDLLDFLEKSECNLFFNPTLGAWGLLDGNDKIVATAHTVRSTLVRAVETEKPTAEVAHG